MIHVSSSFNTPSPISFPSSFSTWAKNRLPSDLQLDATAKEHYQHQHMARLSSLTPRMRLFKTSAQLSKHGPMSYSLHPSSVYSNHIPFSKSTMPTEYVNRRCKSSAGYTSIIPTFMPYHHNASPLHCHSSAQVPIPSRKIHPYIPHRFRQIHISFLSSSFARARGSKLISLAKRYRWRPRFLKEMADRADVNITYADFPPFWLRASREDIMESRLGVLMYMTMRGAPVSMNIKLCIRSMNPISTISWLRHIPSKRRDPLSSKPQAASTEKSSSCLKPLR